MIPYFVFRLLLFTHLALLLSACYGNGSHDKRPSPFNCGSLGRIHYPFTKAEEPECGLIAIHGCDNSSSDKTIELENGRTFLVTSILQQDGLNSSPQITNFDQVLHDRLQSNGSCEAFNNNITLPANSPLVSFDIKYNVTLYRCNHSLNVSPPTGFIKHLCPDYNIYHYSMLSTPNHTEVSSFSACSVIVLPKKDLPDTDDLQSFLTAQTVLDVRLSDDCDNCYNQDGGMCGLDSNNNFYCDKGAAEHKSMVLKLALGLGLALSIGVVVLLLLFVACCFIRKPSSFLWTKKHPTHQIIETFFKEHGPLSTRRYTYDEIEKATNYFKHKLGQGGYGSVYKGKLQDGSLIAVKLLSELKGTGEEFINEVASISRTSHVNIVSLLGFCFQGSKRALIYEFMPNGSLEKFIYEDNTNMVDRQLDCKTLYDIAIGVARGLEYLHRGCNTRILHFDIKPHNILLDEDFCPKISDFGLAKVCSRKESIVSLLGARGTAGYIAPEVFSRSFGGVSHKSDVYSYGMMVLEMVGGRRNINVEVDCSSEIYFPHWIYKRLELNQELELRCIKNDTDERVRKMSVVSLWCIQTNPLMRPEMRKLVEMVEGSLESLQIPPKPYLSSPPTSPAHYSTQTFILNVRPPSDFMKHTCPGYDLYYDSSILPSNHEQVPSSFSKCSVLQLPRKDLTDTKDLLSFLTAQMVIEVRLSDECDKCYNHMGGQCRLDRNRTFLCDKVAQRKRKVMKLGLGLALSIGVFVVLLFMACCFIRKLSTFPWTKKHPTHQIIEAFLKEHGPLSTRRHTYSELEKATNYFKHKLGQGGYGSVYKGKLQDGSLIAVKVLSELKGTCEEFINEVASISRTSHVNIVSLKGFCFQGSKRALIYEFMPNGSLEKFIYEDNTNMVDRQLDCKTLYDIAIGVARGLEYLHRGCNTRILHFDIKPHNILLDEDFCPKISDFGLAKVCSRKESIVSLLGARGTAGYIAPEVFSRSFGGVSHKSDVYSYGMMVLEMVGGRRNINVEVECSSEIYFPHWIYKRLELNHELGLRCIKNDTDKERMKKMTLVSLWCIQTDPSMRPAMSKVVEMLEVPPKPYLSSPPTSPAHYSTQTFM
ncbi:LEAF RUST 10 DISEASE-RESISTANCE LOCUS RECEPTOR-LIKE PROTEIN KINASE-like 2.4 isoform X1 [Senna tora]|uniref:LEAF RUST 10 DISEASE-RESISTANCE LOCUS RECEPTOR-LIKE PROTEIN KINASE-like 2.4 isoform X1 n=1 Tax=Senna tora TaxID=362788 RepID=A0A834WLS4_9FABA|nr:LEAF RUST 10 DISEASE-RESISTANCE LOCUS RECEPTOR-LIKE PROTEIN KINASE-like 2.4 isoform X1 [Senna tora]